MKNTTIVAVLLLVTGCMTEQRTYAPELIGTWEPVYLVLENADADSSMPMGDVFMATPKNWVKVTGIKPIRITYSADGTFSQEHRDKNDSLFLTSHGSWYTVEDSLYWFQSDPDTFRLTFQYKVELDTLHLNGIVDFDRDGRRNDKYTGLQKRITE